MMHKMQNVKSPLGEYTFTNDHNHKYDDTKGENVCIRSEIIRGLQDLPGNIKTVLAQDNKVSNQYLGHLE